MAAPDRASPREAPLGDLDESAAFLGVLRDRSARPRAPGPEAHVADLLRGRVLERIAQALSPEGLEAMLVKGAALALTHYPPATRPMGDVNLLVREADRARVLAALERDGFIRHIPPGRPVSAEKLYEVQYTVELGAISSVVEVHTSLDKIVARPLRERDLFARALPVTGSPALRGLLVPSPEDHALLIALHAAGHELRHPIAFLDLELLLRAGLDIKTLAARAHEARLGSVMYVVMATLRALGAASVTDALVATFDPGSLRRAAIARFYDVGSYPVAKGPLRLGLPWILRQTPLRDDLSAWARGVAVYAALRAADRLLTLNLWNSRARGPRAESGA